MEQIKPIMKHMIAARLGGMTVLHNAMTAGFAEKLCLIIDLGGRLRVLAKLGDHQDRAAIENRLGPELQTACEDYWAREIWFDREKTHPMGKAGPAEVALFLKVWGEAKAEPAGQNQVFTLDRRYSKEAWFSTDVEAVWKVGGQMPPIVSFYSYKGGVGRTTALAALAIQFARAGKRVLVMDFDLEAPGIGSVFSAENAVPEAGILDFLLEHPVVGNAFDPAEMLYSFNNQPVIKDGEPVFVAVAGTVDEWYLEKLGRLNYHGLFESLAPARDSALKVLFHKLRAQAKPDLILVDSRAGLHDLGGLTLCGLAHWHVLFGLDSEQSWLGLRVAVARLGKEQILGGRTQRDIVVVHSMVPPQDGKEESIERFRQQAFDVFRAEYYNDPADANAEWPLPDAKATEEPHYSIPLIYDNKVMGYRNLEKVADYLCEGDFGAFGSAVAKKVGLKL